MPKVAVSKVTKISNVLSYKHVESWKFLKLEGLEVRKLEVVAFPAPPYPLKMLRKYPKNTKKN